LAELQTKLANLILGLKTQPELDQLVHDADSARAHAPVTDTWGPPPGEPGWVSTTSPSRADGGSSAGGGWGTSPSRAASSPVRGGAWGVSPNTNGAETAGWGGQTSTGWQSPTPKTNTGWNK
jgi:DNA-directed RNA polymerase II subunit RPB3